MVCRNSGETQKASSDRVSSEEAWRSPLSYTSMLGYISNGAQGKSKVGRVMGFRNGKSLQPEMDAAFGCERRLWCGLDGCRFRSRDC